MMAHCRLHILTRSNKSRSSSAHGLLLPLLLCWSMASILNCCGVVSAFYVPGVHPHSYKDGEEVPVKVNALTSTHTQIPRDYYRLAFCQPQHGPKRINQNLGQTLTGNKIQTSPYAIRMSTEVYCAKLCQVTLDRTDAAKLRLHIKYGYHHNWIVDNLPSAAIGGSKHDYGQEKKRYAGGFPIGFIHPDDSMPYIYNHANIHIQYHPVEDGNRIVGFAVEPLSIKHQFRGNYVWDGHSHEGFTKPLDTCPNPSKHMSRNDIATPQVVQQGQNILFTYDVSWDSSDVEWSSRWDVYLSNGNLVPPQVRWHSITNSILLILFLSWLVISVMVRNLRREIAACNARTALADLADVEKEDQDMDNKSGWKVVHLHADVFRPPSTHPMLYCVFLGSGAQLCVTALLAILFSAVGFLNPSRRGSLMNAILVLYMLSGPIAGFISSRLYKAFRGAQTQRCTLITAVFFPGLAFGMFVIFNIMLWIMHSTASAPLLEVLTVAVMWCCVTIPLVFVGAYFGNQQDAMEFPTLTSPIARSIPPPPPLHHPMVGMVLAGMIPFAAAYVELFFIMSSLWMHQVYYVFGFTLMVYVILIITCAEMTVLLVYYQLCAENHRWWWYAFFVSGNTALYNFLYSIAWFRTLEASHYFLMTYLLYFGYMFLICFAMLLMFGSVGALTSLWFVRKIYSAIKVE